MTEASHNVFVDRRTPDQQKAELATHVLFWYDNPNPDGRVSKKDKNKSRNGRIRTNACAITTDGHLVVARTVCYVKDPFNKKLGRRKAEQQILGRAQTCAVLSLDEGQELPEAAAAAYSEFFADEPVNENGRSLGAKRAFNAGKIFAAYRAEIKRRADELDDFNG